MILVDVDKVGASRPGRDLFRDLSLTVSDGDRLGVVGLNGTGKSTLLRVLAGDLDPETGVVRRGRDTRVGFLGQRPTLPAGTVRAAVGDHWEAAAILDRLGMSPLADAPTSTLSGGQAKRVALARLLVTESDLLVLDEPTNHLDIAAIEWLEARLASFRGGLVLVTHDRHVLDRVTNRVLELDRGRGYVHEGGYQAYLDARAAREEHAVDAEATRRNLARKELAWLRRGAPARTRKPRARIEAAMAIVDGRMERAAREGDLELDAWRPPRLGDKVIEASGLAHRWTDAGPFLFEGLDVVLDNRDRLGVLGPNGSGKSTLLDVLSGRVVPVAGRVDVGPTVRLGYYDQLGADLDVTMRVRDAVAGPTRTPSWEEDRLLERFWFDADARYAAIGTLSGGERRRLQLLLVLAQRPNVVFLDEPTNDLDLDTLRTIEDFFDDWPGALVVVSHDRAFLERTVERTVTLGSALTEPSARARPQRGDSAKRSEGGGPKRRPPTIVRKELKAAERAVDTVTGERDAVHAELAGVAAASGDHVALRELTTRLIDVEQRLAAAEERWLALAEEAEDP